MLFSDLTSVRYFFLQKEQKDLKSQIFIPYFLFNMLKLRKVLKMARCLQKGVLSGVSALGTNGELRLAPLLFVGRKIEK